MGRGASFEPHYSMSSTRLHLNLIALDQTAAAAGDVLHQYVHAHCGCLEYREGLHCKKHLLKYKK